MTDYGPTDNQKLPPSCQHCWHVDTTQTSTVAVYPPVTPRVCCHCGLRELYRPPTPPIPEGHGPYYPQPFRYGTFTTTGGSGGCGCTLAGPITTTTNDTAPRNE